MEDGEGMSHDISHLLHMCLEEFACSLGNIFIINWKSYVNPLMKQ